MIDETDRKILSLLKKDSRMQYAEIGKKVNLSAPAVHARVKRMEKDAVIRGYSVDINSESLGLGLCAFVRIGNSKCLSSDIAKHLQKFPQIEECHSVAGEDCVMVKLRAHSTLELSKLIESIREFEAIDRTLTVVVMETHFERGIQP
ncbi:Lrp/AsnC family transcriptional regulator [Bdellovibrio sp. HCB337]|uniref:Lrp/AsnC family transcriptional regulator n=1 Tax=Bdellovibrio sp. HCB337 TaxID=3394358 RepID=UPI0039A6C270